MPFCWSWPHNDVVLYIGKEDWPHETCRAKPNIDNICLIAVGGGLNKYHLVGERRETRAVRIIWGGIHSCGAGICPLERIHINLSRSGRVGGPVSQSTEHPHKYTILAETVGSFTLDD